jgi:tubulin gamma
VDNYGQHEMFRDGAGNFQQDEFDDAREVVHQLTSEYEACESPDYIEKTRG